MKKNVGYDKKWRGGRGGGRGLFFFFQAKDGIRDIGVTGVQTCALPIWRVQEAVPSASHNQ